MTKRRCVVSIPRWAEHVGLADDGRSIATARQMLARGEGPAVTERYGRRGVNLRDHARWARPRPWAKYLSACAAVERAKRERARKRFHNKKARADQHQREPKTLTRRV